MSSSLYFFLLLFHLLLRVDPKLFGRAVPVAFMGAPVILNEKLEGGRELEQCVRVIQQILSTGKQFVLAILCAKCVYMDGIWCQESVKKLTTMDGRKLLVLLSPPEKSAMATRYGCPTWRTSFPVLKSIVLRFRL